MFRSAAITLFFLILPTFSSAQEVTQRQQVSHEVVRGETLWTLAEQYYGNPYRWPFLYEANASKISNPNLLEPGLVLIIPGVGEAVVPDQQPDVAVQVQEVMVVTGEQAAAAARPVTPPGEGVRAQATNPQESPCPGPGDRTLFFAGDDIRRRCGVSGPISGQRTPFYPIQPGEAQAEQAFSLARPGEPGANDAVTTTAVPLGLVYAAEWLDQPGMETPPSGIVAGFSLLHTVRAPEGPVRSGERVILEAEEGARFRVGDLLQSYRISRTDRRMGSVNHPSGVMVVTEAGPEQIVATVSSEFDRIWIGDMVRPVPSHTALPGVYPVAIESDVTATVLGFPEDRPMQGFGASVFLDLGTGAGIEIGDVFRASVAEPGPGFGLESALIQVILVDADGSTGRIMSMKNPGLAVGHRLRLIAKIH